MKPPDGSIELNDNDIGEGLLLKPNFAYHRVRLVEFAEIFKAIEPGI